MTRLIERAILALLPFKILFLKERITVDLAKVLMTIFSEPFKKLLFKFLRNSGLPLREICRLARTGSTVNLDCNSDSSVYQQQFVSGDDIRCS